MKRRTILAIATLLILGACGQKKAGEAAQSFSFQMHFNYPASPGQVYDLLTGDISAWWDHSFSGNPDSLYIEAWPGGGFYERFNDAGDGVRHAVVTYALRGKMLRMEGPLGLSGQALTGVYTYHLESTREGETQLTLEVNVSGQVSEETADVVQSVWEHFLWERFRPYLESTLE